MTRPFRPPVQSIAVDAASGAGATRRAQREAADRASSRRAPGASTAGRSAGRRTAVRARPAVTLTLLGLLAGAGTGAAASETGLAGVVDLARGVVGGAPAGTDVLAADDAPAVAAASRDSTREALGTAAPVVPTVEEALDADALAAAQAAEALAAAQAAEAAAQSAALAAAQVPPPGVSETDFLAGILTPTLAHRGDGTFFVVPGEVPAPGAGEVKSVRIQVENGLEVDAEKFATLVLATLNDPRSWGGDGSQTFARTESAAATLTVSLASPDLVDDLCAPLDTEGLWSCGVERHAVLNSMRWSEGSGIYGDDRVAYRQYLVNHEVGHVLGHKHVLCSGRTSTADVMVQQSGAVLGCVPNGWPFP